MSSTARQGWIHQHHAAFPCGCHVHRASDGLQYWTFCGAAGSKGGAAGCFFSEEELQETQARDDVVFEAPPNPRRRHRAGGPRCCVCDKPTPRSASPKHHICHKCLALTRRLHKHYQRQRATRRRPSTPRHPTQTGGGRHVSRSNRASS